MSEQPDNATQRTAATLRGNTLTELVETMRLGLQVYASEMRWLGYALLRRFEISRLAKRLDEEYTRLGHLSVSPTENAQDKELSHKQISFLKDEIAILENELEARRILRVNTLRSRQGHAPVDGIVPEKHASSDVDTANNEM